LDCIPEDCELAKGLRWAIDLWDGVSDILARFERLAEIQG